MEELPRKLKLELAMVIHQSMYSDVTFFKNKDRSFIAWIAKPLNFEGEDYIYKEGEEILESKDYLDVIILFSLLHGEWIRWVRAATLPKQDI